MPAAADSDFRCGACGAEVHPNARACTRCGAKKSSPHQRESAWQQDDYLDGLDLPDQPEDFDYDDFVAREFGEDHRPGPKPIDVKKLFWWISAVITLIAFAFLATR